MSVAASVALAVAERVERTGGPRAGLLAWKTLAGNATDGEVRGKALLAALRCAVILRDVDALGDLTALWETVDRGVWNGPIADLCTELTKAALVPRAVALAAAEALRHRTARSLYCHARCLDVARDARAPDVFGMAIKRASSEGAKEIELASRVRRAAILARSWDTMDAALDEARSIDLKQVTPASALVVAGVLLWSPSRFTRATAIGVLDELASGDDPALALRAMTLAAEYADEVGDALTPLETERLLALFGRERAMKLAPNAKETLHTLARIAASKDADALTASLSEAARRAPLASLHARARDVLRGRFEVPAERGDAVPADAIERAAWRWNQILDVVVAMRDRASAHGAHGLRKLTQAQAAGERLPPQVLAIVEAALEHEDEELREAAVGLVSVRLRMVARGAPPRGWVRLADTLAALGKTELADLARRAAVVAKEPGAAESLGIALSREAWQLASAGERARAIKKLRDAKALLGA